MRGIINREVLVIAQFENCYYSVCSPNRWRPSCTKHQLCQLSDLYGCETWSLIL